ncbi:MAG TPA: hypothetical protein VG015_09955 [Candidatus Dormibacteraeota bacterium]|jgi:hypothetical protein|nr:hypothetical protein [Candidatus Dormibacteraeota bacterium]
MASPCSVYIESGTKKVFACAYDWPGWCRGGKNEPAALAALESTTRRYQLIADLAGVDFDVEGFEVCDRIAGSSTTDFGVPAVVTEVDRRPLGGDQAARLATLVEATWTALDLVYARAPTELRKGPRGGGRNRDAIYGHVLGAEVMYARKLGIKLQEPAITDRDAIAELRQSIRAVLAAPSSGQPLLEGGWVPAYAARRIGWHVIDHAWEIEDRMEPSSAT